MNVFGNRLLLTPTGPSTDLPADMHFDPDEIAERVACEIKFRKCPPEAPAPNLRDAMRMTGRHGGFLGRKSDGEPGTETL